MGPLFDLGERRFEPLLRRLELRGHLVEPGELRLDVRERRFELRLRWVELREP